MRSEFGRWWSAEDQTDTHIAHRLLNEQHAIWARGRREFSEHARRNIQALKMQQRMQLQIQQRRMYQQKRQIRRGGYGGGGYGGGGHMSPVIPYRTMQWGDYQIRVDQEIFEHVPISPVMLKIGRAQLAAVRRRTAAVLLLAGVAAWLLLWWLAPGAGIAVTLAVLLLATAYAAAQGHHPVRRRPPVPRLKFIPAAAPGEAALDGDPEPFPLGDAGRSPREAKEALRLALKKEGATPDVGVPAPTDWGWRYPVTLTSGTLEDLVRRLPAVGTTLRVGANRIFAQSTHADTDSSAVTVRILTKRPFADADTAPARSPLSVSITGEMDLGPSIDGDGTPVILAGQHVLVVGVTGAGKSAMIRRLAEYVTACTDAVAVDVDPTGVGLGPLRPAAARGAYTPEAAERALQRELARAEARIASLGSGIDDNWVVGPDSPAVVVFCDEYARLTPAGKAAALALLGIGRKARSTLVLSTRDATRDVLGEAIADSVGVRILMPCRAADVPLVVGESTAVAQGWLPHLLKPSPGEWEQADAGKFYAITPRSTVPIVRYVPRLDPAVAAELAQQRVSSGLPDIDATPAAAAASAKAAANVPPILQTLRAAFTAAGDPEWLATGPLADLLADADATTWGRWDGRTDRTAMVGRTLRAELRRAGLADAIPTQRLETQPGRPTIYRLADVVAALP
ncbi:ATP-binding protein [Streptomyces sp. NPDC048434]|uniref:ATP-binding protein n=1 Tax=Streptomyces sp. NPDC048434 TaxID=3365549 RepID=UPI00371222E3